MAGRRGREAAGPLGVVTDRSDADRGSKALSRATTVPLSSVPLRLQEVELINCGVAVWNEVAMPVGQHLAVVVGWRPDPAHCQTCRRAAANGGIMTAKGVMDARL